MSAHSIYASLETAKMLKAAGFDWHTNLVYVDDKLLTNPYTADWNSTIPDTYTSAPTLEVAQKWLREVKNCQMEVSYMYDSYGITLGKYIGIYTIQDKRHESLADEEIEGAIKLFDNYERAQEAIIKKCLTILLEEKK